MKRLLLILGMAVMVLPWLAGGRAEAEQIQWSESVTLLGPNVFVNGHAQIYSNNGYGGSGGIGLNPGNTTNGTNSESVVAVNMGEATLPGITSTFGGPSANYSLSLTLHDLTSGASGSLTFGGNFNGDVWPGGYGNLKNTFIGPTTQTLNLGRNLYTVTIGPFVNPWFPEGNGTSVDGGTISASISVQPSVSSAPEPSSLVLACLGLPPLGLTRWLRRRKGVDHKASKT